MFMGDIGMDVVRRLAGRDFKCANRCVFIRVLRWRKGTI